MTSVAPPPPPPPPVGSGNAAQLTVTLSTQASAQLSKMALDSLISGLIKAPALPQGETILQTGLGNIAFKSPFTLPPNAQATFKVVQTEPAVQIQLTHINGKAIPPNTPASRVQTLANQFMQMGKAPLGAQTHTTTPRLGNAAAPATLLHLNTASGIKAFVLPNAQNQMAQTGLSAQTAPQTTTANTATQGNTNTPTNQQTASVIKGASTSQAQAGQQSGANNPLQAGNQLNVRLLTVQQPGQTATNLPAPSNNTPVSTNTVIIQGTVTGRTAAGQPIVKVPQGQIALDTSAKIPEGTQIKMEILSSHRPAAKPVFAATGLGGSDSMQSLTKHWPALEEALTHLKEINPAIADNLSNALLPKADSRLALNMIFFLKALGRGNFNNWASDSALKALARSKPELLKKLENDFSQISDKAKQPNSTDWKISYVPMQDNERINQIRIAQRDHKDEENEGKEDPGVRFVIDINLSNLGAMQFDGLAKDKHKRFDLIIRTHATLPGFMRRDIHDIYAHGMDVIGFDGKISFQVTSHFVQVEGNDLQGASLNLGMLV